MVWLKEEEIQFEAGIGEVFKLDSWLGRAELPGEVDGLLWNLVMAEVTEEHVEGPNLDEEIDGGIWTDFAVMFLVSLANFGF